MHIPDSGRAIAQATAVFGGFSLAATAVALLAGAANDVNDILANERHGIPIPQCRNVSLVRPLCR